MAAIRWANEYNIGAQECIVIFWDKGGEEDTICPDDPRFVVVKSVLCLLKVDDEYLKFAGDGSFIRWYNSYSDDEVRGWLGHAEEAVK